MFKACFNSVLAHANKEVKPYLSGDITSRSITFCYALQCNAFLCVHKLCPNQPTMTVMWQDTNHPTLPSFFTSYCSMASAFFHLRERIDRSMNPTER